MTDTITTAAELYSCNSDMQALIKVWVDERRCPLPLVDLLLENGLESQAEAARWAATKEKRPVDTEWIRPVRYEYPYPNIGTGNYVWAAFEDRDQFSRDVPRRNINKHCTNNTVEQAILWLLDNWVK